MEYLSISNNLDKNVTDKVKRTCKHVHKSSKHVKINENKLLEFINVKRHYFNQVPSWTSSHFDPNDFDLEQVIAFICVIDSLNFCFWPNSGIYIIYYFYFIIIFHSFLTGLCFNINFKQLLAENDGLNFSYSFNELIKNFLEIGLFADISLKLILLPDDNVIDNVLRFSMGIFSKICFSIVSNSRKVFLYFS